MIWHNFNPFCLFLELYLSILDQNVMGFYMEVDTTSRENDRDKSDKEINRHFYCHKWAMDALLKFYFLPTKQLGGLNKWMITLPTHKWNV
jgi:hypothetical protein